MVFKSKSMCFYRCMWTKYCLTFVLILYIMPVAAVCVPTDLMLLSGNGKWCLSLMCSCVNLSWKSPILKSVCLASVHTVVWTEVKAVTSSPVVCLCSSFFCGPVFALPHNSLISVVQAASLKSFTCPKPPGKTERGAVHLCTVHFRGPQCASEAVWSLFLYAWVVKMENTPALIYFCVNSKMACKHIYLHTHPHPFFFFFCLALFSRLHVLPWRSWLNEVNYHKAGLSL